MRRLLLVSALLFALTACARASGNSLVENESRQLLAPEDACGRDSFFEAFVLVEHEMNVSPKVTESVELRVLKRGFQQVYNMLTGNGKKNQPCDAQHYRYSHLPSEIEAQEIFYAQLPLGQSGRPARRNFLYKLKVSGKSVTSETRMFAFEEETTEEGPSRGLFEVPDNILTQASEAVCQCPADSELREPFEEEFTKVFNNFIRKQRQRGKLRNIGRAIHVTEFEIVDCKPETYDYETNVTVELGGPGVRRELDIPQMESNFQDSYNDLNSQFCDPCFRVVISSTFKEIDQESSNSNRDLKKKKNDKRLINKVIARCRKKAKCIRRRKLFDDASETDLVTRKKAMRMLLSRNDKSSNGEIDGLFKYNHKRNHGTSRRKKHRARHQLHRRVQNNVCYCPTQPTGYRAPDTDEFQYAFNKITKLTDRRIAIRRVTE